MYPLIFWHKKSPLFNKVECRLELAHLNQHPRFQAHCFQFIGRILVNLSNEVLPVFGSEKKITRIDQRSKKGSKYGFGNAHKQRKRYSVKQTKPAPQISTENDKTRSV